MAVPPLPTVGGQLPRPPGLPPPSAYGRVRPPPLSFGVGLWPCLAAPSPLGAPLRRPRVGLSRPPLSGGLPGSVAPFGGCAPWVRSRPTAACAHPPPYYPATLCAPPALAAFASLWGWVAPAVRGASVGRIPAPSPPSPAIVWSLRGYRACALGNSLGLGVSCNPSVGVYAPTCLRQAVAPALWCLLHVSVGRDITLLRFGVRCHAQPPLAALWSSLRIVSLALPRAELLLRVGNSRSPHAPLGQSSCS